MDLEGGIALAGKPGRSRPHALRVIDAVGEIIRLFGEVGRVDEAAVAARVDGEARVLALGSPRLLLHEVSGKRPLVVRLMMVPAVPLRLPPAGECLAPAEH